MSLTEPFLWRVLFELDTFTNWRHYKYLGFKTVRVTCGWDCARGMNATWKVLSAFPLVLVIGGRRVKTEGEDTFPGEGFPYQNMDK
jgi:hypothetical protein